jgi:hypothetical protein
VILFVMGSWELRSNFSNFRALALLAHELNLEQALAPCFRFRTQFRALVGILDTAIPSATFTVRASYSLSTFIASLCILHLVDDD